MKFNKISEKVKIFVVLTLALFLLTGCGSSGGGSETIEKEQGYGYIEGYVYETDAGD